MRPGVRRGFQLHVGDRVLSPVRGTVHRRHLVENVIEVRLDGSHEIRVCSPQETWGALRERIVRCRGCGMWKHRSGPCGSCEALARVDDAPDGYGDDAR